MTGQIPWWGQDGADWPEWTGLWEKTTQRFDELPCLTTGAETLTYRTLDERARRAARCLEEKPGWREFPLVAIGVDGAEFLVWAIGAWLAGGTTVPFCKQTVEGDSKFRDRLTRLAGFLVEGNGFDRVSQLPGKPGNLMELARLSLAGWHGIYFTSGSTGEPRAVVRGWKQAYFEAKSYSTLLELAEGDRCVSLIRPFFGASTKHLLGCLLAGCHQWMLKPGDPIPPGRVLYATPSQLQSSPLRSNGHGGFAWVSLTGEAPTDASWPAIQGWARPAGKVLNALGGTEFGVAAVEITSAGMPGGGFAGQLVDGKTLKILTEDGKEAPPGEQGLLRVSSPCLAEGYLDLMPDGSFQLDTFDATRGVATGDVGLMDSTGLLRITGRAGRMVKRGGKWLDSQPLTRLLSRYPGIQEFSVEKIGDSRESIAWLVPRAGEKLDLVTLREEMFETLGERALVPARLVAVASIPVNRHGKANPAALSDPCNRGLILAVNEGVCPLEEIAREVDERLRIGKGQFKKPFVFDSDGLDSLHWHELATAIGNQTGKRFSIADLIALNRGDESVLDNNRNGSDGLRVFSPRQPGANPAGSPSRGMLWLGGGIGTVTSAVEPGTAIWHWDCDHCMADPVTWEGATIQSMASHFLSQAGRLPDLLRVGGFSLGALVAYEMVPLLVARGHRVEGCILVDPPERRGLLGGALNHLTAAMMLLGLGRLMRSRGKDPGLSLAARIRRAARRLALLRYRGGVPAAPTHLFTSDRNRWVAKGLIHGNEGVVSLVSLGVKRHLESVRNDRAVRLWSRCLVSESSDSNGPLARAA